ncbi:MAG: T9SS C-terminal target domain-containing protein [Bacteroidetes bacterium]|nr:MAG: T9SS C-terminal target domain-containing protein [Bacteroidota bacterium]
MDGVSLRPEAVPIMRMGDSNYAYADSICGLWYDSDSFQVLTFFFNLSQAANFEQRTTTAGAVLDFFFQGDTATTRVDPALARSLAFRAFPNPVQDALTLSFSLDQSRTVAASLWTLQGQEVAVLQAPTTLAAGPQQLSWPRPAGLAAGTYLLRLSVDGQSVARPLQVQP